MPQISRRQLSCQLGTITALLGLMVATFLFVHYTTGGPISCPITGGGCDAVRASSWASIGGVSTPLLGVVGYMLCLGLGLCALNNWAPARILYPLATTGGFVVSLFLTGVEARILHTWCFWCVTSAILMTVTWIASLAQLPSEPPAGD